MKKKLYRSRTHKRIAGVCGGLADYMGISPTIIRLIWALTCFFGPFGSIPFLLYIIAACIIPKEDTHTAEYRSDRNARNYESGRRRSRASDPGAQMKTNYGMNGQSHYEKSRSNMSYEEQNWQNAGNSGQYQANSGQYQAESDYEKRARFEQQNAYERQTSFGGQSYEDADYYQKAKEPVQEIDATVFTKEVKVSVSNSWDANAPAVSTYVIGFLLPGHEVREIEVTPAQYARLLEGDYGTLVLGNAGSSFVDFVRKKNPET